jgi:hypothetical protein
MLQRNFFLTTILSYMSYLPTESPPQLSLDEIIELQLIVFSNVHFPAAVTVSLSFPAKLSLIIYTTEKYS